MKKTLLIFILTVAYSVTTKAQEKGLIELGLGTGVNFSTVSADNGQGSTESLTSFNITASGEYYFSDRWGIKSKLIYDNKGWSDGFIIDEQGNDFTTDFELTYITIPVMANWHFSSKRNWYLHFGPYLGILVGATDSVLGRDLKEAFNTTDLGLAYGIGYKFAVQDNLKLYIEFDGQSGISDIFENNLGNESLRNARSSLNIGALFNL